MKTINLASVKLSPKWFLWAIVAMVILLAVYFAAQWLFNKLRGVAEPVTKKVAGATSGGGGW